MFSAQKTTDNPQNLRLGWLAVIVLVGCCAVPFGRCHAFFGLCAADEDPYSAGQYFDPGLFGFGLFPSVPPPVYNPNQDYGWEPHPLLAQQPAAILPPPRSNPAPFVAPPQPLLPYGYSSSSGYGDAVASTGGHPFRAYPGRLTINPARLVAPVGQSVVLLAGICDEEGFYIRKQPIEWSISPDSVGTIVEVDRLDNSWFYYVFHKAPIKRSGAYAIGRTSDTSQVLPRGTADPGDDILVQHGQTWVSISSASEGSTHVTAVAPTVEGWSERQQTATIHWVDGRWQFPSPTVSSYGGGQTLVTRVQRATDGSPVEGWLVRYEVAGGTPAAFDMTGAQTIEVPTNSVGEAAVTVIPQGDFSGTTNINMQVIRRGRSAGDLSRLPVGQGSTSITWSGGGEVASVPANPVLPTIPSTPNVPPAQPESRPSLSVRISGASIAEIGASVVYQYRVENLGNGVAENVELSSSVPAELTHVQSSPQASVFGDALRWELGSLSPGMARAVTVTYQVTGAGVIRVCATGSASGAEPATDCVTTQIASNQASIDLVIQGDSQGRVGEQISYDLYVNNRSDQPLVDVVLEAEFDEGLSHVGDTQGSRSIDWNVGAIGPRETRVYPLNFSVVAAGRRCFSVVVKTTQGASDREDVCVDIAPALSNQPPPGGFNPPPVAPPLNPSPEPPNLGGPAVGPGPSSLPNEPDLNLRVRPAGANPSNPRLLVYVIEVTNTGIASDSNVVLEVLIPNGTRLVGRILPPNVREIEASADGRKHVYSPVATLRPGETLSFHFNIEPTVAPIGDFLARVRSDRYQTPLDASDRDL